jgi:hypothetical protein
MQIPKTVVQRQGDQIVVSLSDGAIEYARDAKHPEQIHNRWLGRRQAVSACASRPSSMSASMTRRTNSRRRALASAQTSARQIKRANNAKRKKPIHLSDVAMPASCNWSPSP